MSFSWPGHRMRSTRAFRSAAPAPVPAHSLIATLKGETNLQNDSPLFSTIPPELRNIIFQLTLTSYDDESAPYPENTHYNRPGYRFRHRIDTALLSTCRRVYHEAHILPVSLNEHVFWASSDRGPRDVHFCDDPVRYLSRLTVEQRKAVEQVHLFTQMFWLEDNFPVVCMSPVFRMRHLKITVRHGDWWNWELNKPLAMQDIWTTNLKEIANLEVLEVELETMERDKSQLEAIVKMMQTWRIKVGNDRTLTPDVNRASQSQYTGPSNYDGFQYDDEMDSWLWPSEAKQNATVPASPLFYVGYTLYWVATIG